MNKKEKLLWSLSDNKISHPQTVTFHFRNCDELWKFINLIAGNTLEELETKLQEK